MFYGSIVALITPLCENGSIDFPCLRNLVDWHVAQHTDAILVFGTTGEPATMSSEEKKSIMEVVVEQADGRIPIIAATGTYCTQNSIDLTRIAMEIGVQACLLVTPYYNCPTQEGLYQHYRLIAEKVPIPQILYNIPKRTGVDLLPETVFRLAGITNIIGIKEGRPAVAKAIIERCGTQLDVYSGDDHAALDIMQMGGKGVISVLANLLPKAMHELGELARNASWENAAALNQQLQPFYAYLFVETNPIPVKWLAAMSKLIATPRVRLPLTTLSLAQQAHLKPLLDRLMTFN